MFPESVDIGPVFDEKFNSSRMPSGGGGQDGQGK